MKTVFRFTDGQWNMPASDDAINAAVQLLGVQLPGDYLAFVRSHNGGEGFVRTNYIIIWRVEDLAKFNREYEVEEYAPGVLLFGSNGGGEGYGFDTQDKDMPVVRVPFIGMERRYMAFVAPTFTE